MKKLLIFICIYISWIVVGVYVSTLGDEYLLALWQLSLALLIGYSVIKIFRIGED